MKCPSCGASASGKFCSACGQPLEGTACPTCGNTVGAGSRFCTACGSGIEGEAGSRKASGNRAPHAGGLGSGQNLGWWVAGALMVVTLVALGYPALKRSGGVDGGVTPPPGMGSTGAGTSQVDLTTMPIPEQATILFNRVMASSSSGDSADVAFFLPKALIIHEQMNPTDPDGLYHFALLHQVGGEYQAALAKAQEGLEEIPDYLLLLAVAAQASLGLGDEEAARGYYSRYLEVFDTEMALVRPGYEHHTQIFPAYRAEAEAYLGGG